MSLVYMSMFNTLYPYYAVVLLVHRIAAIKFPHMADRETINRWSVLLGPLGAA